MKKIIIISRGIETCTCIWEQLNELIGDEIAVEMMCLDEWFIRDFKDILVLITSPFLKEKVLKLIPLGTDYIIASRIINYKYINQIINITNDSKVLLVNDSKETCNQAVSQLLNMGLDHIKYYPYYPKIQEYPKLEVCITFGESKFAPACVKNIIDLGSRYVDITTLIDILKYFKLMKKKGNYISSFFTRDIIKLSERYNTTAKIAIELKSMFETIIENSKYGIVYLDVNGKIAIANETFSKIINNQIDLIKNNYIYIIIPQLKNWKVPEYEEEILSIKDKSFAIAKAPVTRDNKIIGYMLTLEDVSKIQKLEYEIRRQQNFTSFKANYTFDNIIGKSSVINDVKDLAKKLSKSESTILLYGESGTGKELFAQAIHNYSRRKDAQFVPVNFAALSTPLLESELFGYEEGSFTGAKKGGKPGLFEIAHGGTIFLDEIGEIPTEFQVKLLRVLQERQVIRVGGTKLISINVRVIVATNKDLTYEINMGNFRRDLFYRINVLPISIPSLKERKEDVPILAEAFLKRINCCDNIDVHDYFDKDCLEFLNNYDWPGNIRELDNVVEYITNIKEENKKIRWNDLPQYISRNCVNSYNNDIEIDDLIDKDIIWILNCINKHKNVGRRFLCDIAKSEGLNLGESKIRRLINDMKNLQLVEINKGLSGTCITNKGRKLLNLSKE
jgi:transcriptional regulator with PAS, ATPase and Fis domain